MAHKLLRITQKLHGVPHLISQTSFESISKYLDSRNANLMDFPEANPALVVSEDTEIVGGIGVITLHGPASYRSTGWEAACGGFSYEAMVEACEDLIEDKVSTIVLDIDSGGGEAYNCFTMAAYVRKLCDDNNVKLIAYVDGIAASAAYAIACICDEVVSNPYAEVGSIGVLISLCDKSKYLEKEGLKPVFVSAGKNKIPYEDDGSFKQDFLDDLQGKVDTLYEAFVKHVSYYTGLTSEAVKATEAKTFLAQDALALGLVNKIMTNSEFIDYVIELNKRG